MYEIKWSIILLKQMMHNQINYVCAYIILDDIVLNWGTKKLKILGRLQNSYCKMVIHIFLIGTIFDKRWKLNLSYTDIDKYNVKWYTSI